MTRPVRAGCVAIRASDLRINEWETRLEPTHALRHRERHWVAVTAWVLYRTCRAKRVDSPGEDLVELAGRLGFHPNTFRHVVKCGWEKGLWRVHHRALLGGKKGRPVPLVYTERDLDVARVASQVDRVWASVELNLVDGVSGDFEQRVERVPVFYPWVGEKVRDRGRRVPRMPEAEPDYMDELHAKWGEGWAQRAMARRAEDRAVPKITLTPTLSRSTGRGRNAKRAWEGSDRETRDPRGKFWGWRWVCPGCGKLAHRLYLPVRSGVIEEIERDVTVWCDADKVAKPAMGLACSSCHGVKHYSRVCRGAWNEVVAQLSGGMLYGHEVERPAWFAEARRKRREYVQVHRVPSQRREEVLERWLKRWRYKQIARDLGVSRATVDKHVREVYRQHGVRDVEALIRKLTPEHARPLEQVDGEVRRKRMVELVMAGWTNRQIAQKWNIHRATVEKDLRRIYRAAGVEGREGLRETVNRAREIGPGDWKDGPKAELGASLALPLKVTSVCSEGEDRRRNQRWRSTRFSFKVRI